MIIRQKTPLVLQMSLDAQKGSPGLKRRLSKERLTAPKLDMAKEREDLLHSLERLGEEPQESSNGSLSTDAATDPPQPPPFLQQQDSLQESPKSAKRMSTKMMAKVSMFEQSSPSAAAPRTSTPVNSPQVNGPIDLSSSECIELLLVHTVKYAIVSTVVGARPVEMGEVMFTFRC